MAFDLWTHSFCLACDKQVHIDGAAYCSESCRLADFERKPSPPCSQASSPGLSTPSYPWSTSTTTSTRPSRSKFYLSPAYDFSNAQPYGSTPATQLFFNDFSFSRSSQSASPVPSSTRDLTPSNSHTSLSSMRSISSTSDAGLSDIAKKELQAYAVSFEQVSMRRRRSN